MGKKMDQEQQTKGNHNKDKDKDKDKDMTIDQFKTMLEGCHDVLEQHIEASNNGGVTASLLYCEGMIDTQMFHLGLLPMLERWKQSRRDHQLNDHTNEDDEYSPSRMFNVIESREGSYLFDRLFSGSVIITFSNDVCFYEYNISNQPARSPEESTMELSLKGPRDGFIEQLSVNVALVRKRLRTPNLNVEYFKIGSETQTGIALLHMSDQVPEGLLEEARRRLKAIDVPSINGAGELEELLADNPYALFPLLEFIGRPDYVVQSLMRGRFAVLVDGTPASLIGPGNLLLLIKSPEDAHLPFYFVSLERLLRVFGLALSLFLPGFWVALSSFNTDQIPFSLLATVTISRIGLPMSATMEMFLMLTLFEVFREAGVRLPRPVGQTVSVVGGLIIGDAAIRAGLTSPTMLVVAAVSTVSTFTLVNQSLTGSVSLFRIVILITSSLFGMFGFIIGMFGLMIYMCSLESFGQPYMQPLAPLRFKDLASALLQKPWKLATNRRKKP